MFEHLTDNIKDYNVLEVVSNGRFDTCYKVSHGNINGCLVLKAIDYGFMSEYSRKAFIEEVKMIANTTHPNIVQVLKYINHSAALTLYMVTEFYNGDDLGSLIKKCKISNNFVGEHFIWKVLYQISRALHVCHSRLSNITILHCDIKPSNIIIDAIGNVKLGGFDLAKISLQNNDAHLVNVQTPYYRSPEFINGGHTGKTSDVWSLGSLIFELATLHHVSQEYSEKGKLLPPHYSDDLQKVLDSMLAPNPEQRPTVENILYHPSVVEHVALNSLQQLSLNCKQDCPRDKQQASGRSSVNYTEEKLCHKCKDWDAKCDQIRQKEISLKLKETSLKDKEYALIKRERQIMVMERLSKDKIMRAEVYLSQCKKPRKTIEVCSNLNESSCSADPGDTSLLPTISKLNPHEIENPFFSRTSLNRRTVHFEKMPEEYYHVSLPKTKDKNVDAMSVVSRMREDQSVWLDSKRTQYNASKFDATNKKVRKNGKENKMKASLPVYNTSMKVYSGGRTGSLLSLKASTKELHNGIVETHFR